MFLKKIKINSNSSIFVILAILLIVGFAVNPRFGSARNILSMLRQAVPLGILTLGASFVMISGGVDLSVAATIQLVPMFFTFGYALYGVPGLIIGIFLALLVGFVIGLLNGIVVTKGLVPPFLATLFMGIILVGMRYMILGSKPAGIIPEGMQNFVKGSIGPIPNAIIVLIIIAVLCHAVLNNTVFGRNLIAVGTNKSAANFSGVKVNFTTIVSYCISSVVAVISAIMVSGYIGFADGDIATGYEFDVLLVAVLGGNALGGGRSSVTGILGGAFVVTVLLSIVIIFGLDVNYQYIIKGSILLLAAIINTIVSKK